jgi:hypothetical protein
MDITPILEARLIEALSGVAWGPYAAIGLALIAVGIASRLAGRFFFNYLMAKWLMKRAANPAPEESASTSLMQFFLPFLGKNPNEEFKPYASLLIPWVLVEVSTILVGVVIATAQTFSTVSVAAAVLIIIYISAFMFVQSSARGKLNTLLYQEVGRKRATSDSEQSDLNRDINDV